MSEKNVRAQKIMENIRKVLLQEWDPIGVKDIPEAQDEYDSYAGGVYRLLASHSSAEQIARHLAQIEDEQMGLGPRIIQDLLPVANRLLSIDIRL